MTGKWGPLAAIILCAGVAFADEPVNLQNQPGLVSPAERVLLSNNGYGMDDGMIRLPGKEPLTAIQLAQVLAELKGNGNVRSNTGRQKDSSKPGLSPSLAVKVAQSLKDNWDDLSPDMRDDINRRLVESGYSAIGRGIPPEQVHLTVQKYKRLWEGAATGQAAAESELKDAVVQLPAFQYRPRDSAVFAYSSRPVLTPAPISDIPMIPRPAPPAPSKAEPPSPVINEPKQGPGGTRVASFYVSETLINSIIKEHLRTSLLRDLVVSLDPANGQIVARGLLSIPPDSLKAINLEKGLGDFRFQLTIKLEATSEGYLIFIFPMDQSFFYPAGSSNPDEDRVIVPVQLLSLALASARGYLAVLSGDYSGFDRKAQQVRSQMAALDKQLAATKDPEDRAALQDDRKALELQLESIPIERRQGERMAKRLGGLFRFVGEKEINLSEHLSAHRNGLVLQIKIEQLAPYLKGIQLGGVRIVKDTKDGSGENFLAIDLNAQLAK